MASYFDELVVYKGEAYYTGPFTPPTTQRALGGLGYSLVFQGLFMASISGVSFTVEAINSGTGGLHYHIEGMTLTIDLGGATGVTSAMVAALLEGNSLALVQIVDNAVSWDIPAPQTVSVPVTIKGITFTPVGPDPVIIVLINSGTGGLHYHVDGNTITVDLGGDTNVTATMIAALLAGEPIVTTTVVSGETVWYTPPPATSGTSPSVIYCPPFGDQNSYSSIAHADLEADGFALNIGDFTIQGRFRISKKYKMITGSTEPRYAIVGQYEDYMWDGDVDAHPGDWWALEFTNDTFTFKVWDSFTQEYICNASAPVTINWEASWSDPCNDKLNEDEAYVHIAVSRQGNELRIFVNGVNDTTGGTITDWGSIHEDLKMNGQDARVLPDVPHAITFIEELRIVTGSVLYWDDFIVPTALFAQDAGICIFPRMFPQLIRGVAGDTYGNFSFSPRISGDVLFPVLIVASLGITPGFTTEVEAWNYMKFVMAVNTNQGIT